VQRRHVPRQRRGENDTRRKFSILCAALPLRCSVGVLKFLPQRQESEPMLLQSLCFGDVHVEQRRLTQKRFFCSQSKICSASAAYAYRCRLAGAPLEMPEQCSVCKDVSGGSFNTASGALTTTVTGVDLVFVAQEKSCLR